MKTLVITGQTGSGKTYLANKLAGYYKETIIIKTDSYYKDNFTIRLLSKLIASIYDMSISIKKEELIKTIKSINNDEKAINFFDYDFKTKKSSQKSKPNKLLNKNRFLILEGIFAHRLGLDYKKTINIVCNDTKEICYKRRITRDQIERGRNIAEINRRFDISWKLYNRKIGKFIDSHNVYEVTTSSEGYFKDLISELNTIVKN